MAILINSVLLRNKEVVKEINRHKWLESEKAGKDIGFEKASREWIDRYAQQWLEKHSSKTLANVFKFNKTLNKVMNQKVF